MRHAGCTCVSQARFRRISKGRRGYLPAAMPALPDSMGDQRVGLRRMEIRSLPSLLSPGANHLEPAILSRATRAHDPAGLGSHSLSLRGLPLQLCELPRMQGEIFMAEAGHREGSGSRNDARLDPGVVSSGPGKTKKWFQVTRRSARSPAGMHGQNLASGNGVT
jgi:hypothetical protein